ncbi:MAG: Lrp/AsnC family transcriptional regulator [Syntrophorhabdaceae bacterium]|nr:Lrp/AsnC family transcriptional regulator [Syntrophorhabdaceae bacterium]
MDKDSLNGMDVIDRRILNMLQEEFPLTEKPFDDIGAEIGLGGEEIRQRVASLKLRGYIRRIGPVLDPKRMGYVSLLCGVAAPHGRLEELARAVSAQPAVTHNYERTGELDLWFTVTMKNKEDIERFLSTLEETFSVTIYRFPERRTFKIKTRFTIPVPE